ncbi:MAG: hypothetical protein H6807_17855 [Planctomycetes bacterium]|nr:hypothetical protein [Planctomycetota bacterium]
MRIPDKILSRPAAESARLLLLEALGNLRLAIDLGPRALLRALGQLQVQIAINQPVMPGGAGKRGRRLLRDIGDGHRELVRLQETMEFSRSLEARRGLPDFDPSLRAQLQRRARLLRRELEEERRPELEALLVELGTRFEAMEGRGDRSATALAGGDLLADWLVVETAELGRRFGRGHDVDRLLARVEALEAAIEPWAPHLAMATAALEMLRPLERRLARQRWIEILAELATGALIDDIRALGDGGDRAAELQSLRAAVVALAEAVRGGALDRLESERLFVLRDLPRFASEPAVAEVYLGWLPGGQVDETISRVYEGGAPRHARRIGLGQGRKRVEFEEETSEGVFESLWALTEGCRVRKRRYALREARRRVEIDDFHDRDLVLARIMGGEEAVAAAPPTWLAPAILREVTGEVSYQGRRLGL